MKKLLILILTLLLLISFTGCTDKPQHHPKKPRYTIDKPSIKYTPSKKNLEKMVKQLQGSPYVWAEEGPTAFDCSGFTYYMYGSMGIELPRTARAQAKVGRRISSSQLQYGDLIFFATNKHKKHKITHVGMYLGNGWFTHASTVKHEVIYSNLFKSKYYKHKLRICRRYLPETKHTFLTSKQSTIWEQLQTLDTKYPKKAIVIQASKEQLEQHLPKGHFYIQIGSFIGKSKISMISKIKAQKLQHTIISFIQNGTKVSKLLIGPYKNKKKALQLLQQVRRTIKPTAFIAEIR